jgi:2-dehydro-3-deoxyphosphogluconate aldolase/(4S)-4-hydroxy-2-oxoglutarate aldolase
MRDTGLPHLPGVATVSEVMALLEDGYTDMKFFPAQAAGGAPYLRAIHSPVPAARFCPTGGITPGNIAEYLGTPNVGCVGGSWLTPADAVDRHDWPQISSLATAARELAESSTRKSNSL